MDYRSNIVQEQQPRQYRIVCLIHRADGHLKALGYSENDSGVMYDGTWTLAEARQAIFQGYRLYIVSPSTGDEADLEFADGHIRTKPNQATDASLHHLPDCSQR